MCVWLQSEDIRRSFFQVLRSRCVGSLNAAEYLDLSQVGLGKTFICVYY